MLASVCATSDSDSWASLAVEAKMDAGWYFRWVRKAVPGWMNVGVDVSNGDTPERGQIYLVPNTIFLVVGEGESDADKASLVTEIETLRAGYEGQGFRVIRQDNMGLALESRGTYGLVFNGHIDVIQLTNPARWWTEGGVKTDSAIVKPRLLTNNDINHPLAFAHIISCMSACGNWGKIVTPTYGEARLYSGLISGIPAPDVVRTGGGTFQRPDYCRGDGVLEY